ncbi:hypothetical protein CUT44_12140 [Streptomyces carminius]|uniref:Uncharacterized protein n=1 Tax=Streptomyces carminius TaxID=2665496 RepID=A0A2M8LZR2_9ACTN|nr:hypothetical protein [Streptomyces carminius]PJE97429.1 hypothetical protein CUT44_12140 [Streptomyces carminius]
MTGSPGTCPGGPAHLEWWANPLTCLARVPVGVTVTADGVRYAALPPARGPADDPADDEVLGILVEAGDPVLTLRSADGSTEPVTVERTGEPGRLRLTACREAGG